MKFSIVTLFPELISEVLKIGVVGQAITKGVIGVDVITPRAWTHDIHKTVDDRPFGGGDGMVMMAEPLSRCLDEVLARDLQSASLNQVSMRRIYLSPQGRVLNHKLVIELSRERHLLLLCGRYAGVDQRLLNHYQFEEISVGDYVLSGGELAAMIVVDSVGRQLEGVLGHSASSSEDSFAGAGLLEAPCFTRPREWSGQSVPEFLLTGNHAQVAEDRWFLSVMVTFKKRADLLPAYLRDQSIKRKVWQRALDKLKAQPNNALTSLGLARKDLDDFESYLQSLNIL